MRLLSRLIDPILIGSFNNERKGCVLFLGPFRGSLFHQGLQWLFLVLFLAVFTFAHDCQSSLAEFIVLKHTVFIHFKLHAAPDRLSFLSNIEQSRK